MAEMGCSQLGDAELFEAWKRGDLDAADELLRRHFVAVYRFFASNLTPTTTGADPEDLTQRAFEACISGRDRVRDDFRGYLFGVARRLLHDEWHRRRSQVEVVSPTDANPQDPRTSPSLLVARDHERRLLRDACEHLPLEFRAVLERFYWQERSVAEIAEELGIAVGTVKSRLWRGKAMLGEQLAIRACNRP